MDWATGVEFGGLSAGGGIVRDFVMLCFYVIRTHAIATPKSCQDRKVAAIQDACDRRGIRVTLSPVPSPLLRTNTSTIVCGFLLVAVPKISFYA